MGKIKKAKKIKSKSVKREAIDPAEDQLMEALNSSISIYETHIKTERTDDEKIQATLRDYESYDGLNDEESQLSEHKRNTNENVNSRRKSKKSQKSQPDDDVELTLSSVKNQMQQQTKLLNNLVEASSNMALLMNRFMKAEEKKMSIMQRQMKVNEYQNVFLRRQEARRKFKFITPQID